MEIGIIGYGRRMSGLVEMLHTFDAGVHIAAIADTDIEGVKRRLAKSGREAVGCRFFTDADEMLDKARLDAVMVGTRCSHHAAMAMKVLAKNLPLYLEKPVATNREDLTALAEAERRTKSGVVVSFPLRVSPLVAAAKEVIDSGRIGTVENVNAWCDPPYAAVYFRDWYRDECETGGLWLQKATHDFDYLTFLVGSRPREVAAMTSKRVFKGDRPANKKCRDCDEWLVCLESPLHIFLSRGEGKAVELTEYSCMFAEDTGNEDAGQALVEFQSGVQASYSQNFMVRRAAGRRGARLYGYKGTVEFDWYTDELKVFMHHSPRVETHKIDSSSLSHAGGDSVLIWNFLQVAAGKEKSLSPLRAGLMSVNLCLAAKESSATHTFREVPMLPGEG
jgi:predicted dehydrogenase